MTNPFEPLIFVLLLVLSLTLFLRRVFRLFALLLLGTGENRFDRLRKRLKDMFVYGFGQVKVIESPFGVNHLVLFWGFLTLFLINVEFVAAGVFPGFSLAFIGSIPYAGLRTAADVMSLVVLVAALLAMIRRLFFRPAHIDPTADAFVILGTVTILMAAYFGVNITEICAGKRTGGAMPVSLALSRFFEGRWGVPQLCAYGRVFWWIHAVLFLGFLDYIPWSKHLHILASLPNCFFRRLSFPGTLPRMEFRPGLSFGVSKVTEFTWKDLLDFFSCSECGRCQAACPAHNTGKILNPKRVILQGKKNLLVNGGKVLDSRPFDTLGRAPADWEPEAPLIGDGISSISYDAIWQCTTCGACVERCPLMIEQFPKLLDLRRHLVMEKVRFPEEIVPFFENMEQRSNPWGIAPADRGKWASAPGLNVPLFEKERNLEYLLYVGCVGSFDSRMRQVCTVLTETFTAAGISFGILGQAEKCCGETMRRLGNEYMFEQMAKENVAQFARLGVRKIVTLCPHCCNTFRHDYKAFGANLEVYHHTEMIDMLVREGRLNIREGFGGERIVFHDSCYLGRYNNIYEPPRRLIRAATGKNPLEMGRRKEQSFCCGAGGGLMWMEEKSGTRINLTRTREALEKDPSIIATACPYCLTMFEDGLKECGTTGVRVMDIGEIISSTIKH